MDLPNMVRIRQGFEADRIEDPRAAAREATAGLVAAAQVAPGQSVCLTGSSRGIANVADILAGAVAALKEAGLEPFIVPAMGSHGGGTAERQRAVLHHYGVTEAAIGCPVRSQVATVQVGETPERIPLRIDRLAAEADHILLVNRIKPHSHLSGPCESGLCKILLIGLGKPQGARFYHRAFARHGFGTVFLAAVPVLLERLSILGGLGIVENAYDQTCRIEGIRPADLLSREPKLLAEARRLMPKLPVQRCNLLILDQIGKDISGTGMDPNVIGRDRPGPDIEVILARDLTPASEGNASGIGLADVTTQRVMDKMDWKATFLNCATAVHPHLARAPYASATDREALDAALSATSVESPLDARILWARSTADLAELELSEPLLADLADRPDLERLGPPHPIAFRPDGALVDVFHPPIKH